jgi:AGZA family xanthine/uracil permease-like MFS transporter
VSSLISGLFGTSSGSSYIESATGIAAGGRTGLTAIVAGLLFIPFMFFSPLLSIVPAIATAPALIVVGVFMITPILKIDWLDYEEAIPSFLSIILIPLTFSITQGISWGLLSWTILKLFTGKAKQITPMLIILDIFAILGLIL